MRSRSHGLSLIVVAAVVLLAHSPSLWNGFHYDDGHSLLRNPSVRQLSNLPHFFADPRAFSAEPAYAMYRPLVLTAYALNYALDGYQPWGYLLLNLAVHCLASMLGFLLLRQLLGPSPAALLAALLFGLHPVQTEPVSYISSRSESMAGLFCLAALYAYLRAIRSPAIARGWYAASLLAFGLGLLSKTTALVFPLLLLLYEFLLAAPGVSRRVRLRRHLPYWLLSLAYAGGYAGLTPEPFAGAGQVRDLATQLATQTKALVYYLALDLTPVILSVHPSFSTSGSILELVPLFSLLALGSLAFVAVRRRAPTLLFGLAWFVVCLLPTLVIPLHVLVNDHRLYLSLFGLALVMGHLLAGCGRRWPVYVLCGLFAVLSWQRHLVWRDERTLWQDAVRHGPAMPEAHYNLGHALQQGGDLAQARQVYEKAVELSPLYVRAQVNLGAIYQKEGQLPQAAQALETALQADPNSLEALNNLGLVYAARRDFDQALALYSRALRLAPDRAELWLNLGLAYRDKGMRLEAFQALDRAVRLDPSLKQRFPAAT
jgi:tetratricopeptide (TPR) repeat protein